VGVLGDYFEGFEYEYGFFLITCTCRNF